MFSATAAMPKLELQFMVHSARVMVNLPDRGNCWFFVTPTDRVEDLVSALQKEDSMVKSLEIMTGNSST